ncbi:MAG TPA: hypothetical protein VL137_02895, partial [Polyangiaceae bacterium]|nr:hypothetical protein [Polyangiaceae bacterium]
MANPAPQLSLLNTAAVWGTTVVATRALRAGESLMLGDDQQALIVKPDDSLAPDFPIRAAGSGWEMDLQGVKGGVVYLRGRREDAVHLAHNGGAVPIIPGDFGLLQYGNFSLFFQFATPAEPLRGKAKIDWLLFFGFLFSLASIGGGMLLLFLLFSGAQLEQPLELISQEELLTRFKLEDEPPVPPVGKDE